MRTKLTKFINELQWIDSIIGIIGVCIVLISALFIQLYLHEEPCPLCLLQRAAYINIGLALMLNLRYGNKVSHWAMVILSAVAGAAVSMRQILLHISSPEGYGLVVFGLHIYTWSFIIFITCIIGSVIMLLIYPERKS